MKMSGFYSKEELEAMHFKSLGKNVSISRKASLYHTEEMEIGNNVRIEDFCVLNGNITIGNNVMICVFCRWKLWNCDRRQCDDSSKSIHSFRNR